METHELSFYFYEHILASHYSWSLKDIRALDLQDFYAHLRICMEREAVKNEFQAILAGAKPDDQVVDETEKTVATKRLRSGAVVETKEKKALKFQGKVKRVRINKEGQYVGDL